MTSGPRKSSFIGRHLHLFFEWVWSDTDIHDRKTDWRRQLFRIFFIICREFKRDSITLRASALTFAVVLSLVPMLALGTAVLKGLGAGDQMRQAAYRFIEQIDAVDQPPATVVDQPSTTGHEEIPPTDTTVIPADNPAPKKDAPKKDMTTHLRDAVDQIFNYVDRTDFKALGAFGVFGLVLAVISVLGSIEQAMNAIWQADSGRPFGRKIIDYLALLFLLPLSINLALATEASLHSPKIKTWMYTLLPIAGMGEFLFKMLPIFAVIATFSLLYQFLPNVRVKFIPALAGGIFGGISWLLVQILYVKMQVGVARYNAIYGSFATLPLFLLWLQLAWVIFLTGAETAFAVQCWQHYSWRQTVLSPASRLALAFDLLQTIYNDFHGRRASDRPNLARQLQQPEATVAQVLEDLRQGGFIYMVTGKFEQYVPAAPEEDVSSSELIDHFFGRQDDIVQTSEAAINALSGARHFVKDFNIAGPAPAIPENQEKTTET